MEVQIRGCVDGFYTVYLFHAAKRGLVGVRVGEIRIQGGIGREVFSFDAEAVGKSMYALDRMSGIYMTAEGTGFVARRWDDETVDWDAFHVYGAGQEHREAADGLRETADEFDEFQEEDSEQPEAYRRLREDNDGSTENNGSDALTGEAENDRFTETEDDGSNALTGEEESDDSAGADKFGKEGGELKNASVEIQREAGVSAESVGRVAEINRKVQAPNDISSAPVDISPYMSAWEKQWQRFCASHPLLCPFDEAKDIYAVKMDLLDIRILPKQYHSLANNSFLLHGYFNYRYLLFGHMDGEERRWFIAVPGVFQNQEQLLAGVFGFTEFRTKHVTKQRTGEFGFWYRCLEL